MNLNIILKIFFLSFLYFLVDCIHFNKVLLKDVQAITFRKGEYTIGKKIIPQLKCVSKKNICIYAPEVVQCVNQGYDGIDVQWKCNADLSTKVKFNKLEVNCEGYSYPNDPYIIAGSCGLEYSLTEDKNSNSNEFVSFNYLWIIIIFVLFFYLFMNCKKSNFRNNLRNPFRQTPTAPPPPGFKDDFMKEKYQNNLNSERRTSSELPNLFYYIGVGCLGYLVGKRLSNYSTPQPVNDCNTYSYNRRDFYNDKKEAEGYASTKRRG